ncbi:MAG: T9SS type A sorting domain-containing protein [Weeksellaceae bacterium]|nr:T9SS type A sorting domain-containing protein [Weeksellaceae bacterium]
MKKLLFSLAALAALTTVKAQDVIYYDGFEAYEDFVYGDFGDWKQFDLDGGTTWGITDLDFPASNYVGAGVIFNINEASGATASLEPYAGEKGLYYFAAGASGTAFPNDDWTVSPKIDLTNVTNAKVELYAKGDQSYGPDQFNIGISNVLDVNEFLFVNTSPIAPPNSGWTKYEFDLSEYDGQEIYIALNCTTDDGLILMIDEFKVTGTVDLAVSDAQKSKVSLFPNPTSDVFELKLGQSYDAAKVNVTIADLTGRKVKTFKSGSSYNVSDLTAGVYVVTVSDGTNSFTQKLIKK